MKILISLILTLFVSCDLNHRKTDSSQLSTDDAIIPSFVYTHMKENLSGWQLISNNSGLNESEFDSSKMNFVLADINCDDKVDFTGILKDTVGNLVVYQIRSIKKFYIGSELESFNKDKELDFGLRYLNSKDSFKYDDSSSEIFKCGAIERFNLKNKEKKIFYANENGFFEINSSQ